VDERCVLQDQVRATLIALGGPLRDARLHGSGLGGTNGSGTLEATEGPR
jgi:hypothetical protein